MGEKTIILPVASGKGGVGKSMLTANLAAALALSGQKTVAADLDLGGSNLHTWLHLPNTQPGIGDFIKRRLSDLAGFIVPTAIEHLHFLPGDGRMPFMASIGYAQKMKLIRGLQEIQADFLLLDLGAGSALNTLNFFALAPRGLLVTTPEPTAIMNCLTFLKNFLFHLISAEVRHTPKIHDLTEEAFYRPISESPLSVSELLETIKARDAALAETIETLCGKFRPAIVVNLSTSSESLVQVQRVSRVISEMLSLEVDFWFAVPYDDTLKTALRGNQVFIQAHPDAAAAISLKELAKRLCEHPAA